MSETCGQYTATVVESDDGVRAEIDVRPPFTPSQRFLEDCSADLGTELEHSVTTPNTTRLSMAIGDERLSDTKRIIAFRATAAFIVESLNAVDQGRDTMELEPMQVYDRIAAEYGDHSA